MGSPDNPVTETFLYPHDLSTCNWKEKFCFDTHGSSMVDGITRARTFHRQLPKYFFHFLVPCYSRQFTFAVSLTIKTVTGR